MNFPCLYCQSSVTGMLCVRGAQCQFELEEICIEWDRPCYRSQLTHASPLRTQCVYVCVCVCVCMCVCMCVCVCVRALQVAGRPASSYEYYRTFSTKVQINGWKVSTINISLSVCVCGGGGVLCFFLLVLFSSLYISHSTFSC